MVVGDGVGAAVDSATTVTWDTGASISKRAAVGVGEGRGADVGTNVGMVMTFRSPMASGAGKASATGATWAIRSSAIWLANG